MTWEAVVMVPLMGGLCSLLAKFIEVKLRNHGVFADLSFTEITDVADDQLPRCLRDSRPLREGSLRHLGFAKCGNQVCKRRGTVCYTSHYLSADGRTLLSDCVYRKFFGQYASQFVTALRSIGVDGHVIETSTHSQLPRIFEDMPPEAMLTITAAGTADLRMLIEKHRQQVDKKIESTDSEFIQMSPSRIAEIEDYALQLVDWQMHRKGHFARPKDAASLAFSAIVGGEPQPPTGSSLWTV